MMFVLILAPYMTFAIVSSMLSVTAGLVTASAAGVGLTIADYAQWRSQKLLNLGAVLVFAGLAAYFSATGSLWSAPYISLAINGCVLAIILGSLVTRFPFTLQYAREHVDEATTREQSFLRLNYVLSWTWAGALALMTAADVAAIYLPSLPFWVGCALTFLLRNSAVQFTKWYPKHAFGH
jgi:hypothetical protein